MINTFPAPEAHKTTRFSNLEWARQDDTVRMIEPCSSHNYKRRSGKRRLKGADATEGVQPKETEQIRGQFASTEKLAVLQTMPDISATKDQGGHLGQEMKELKVHNLPLLGKSSGTPGLPSTTSHILNHNTIN